MKNRVLKVGFAIAAILLALTNCRAQNLFQDRLKLDRLSVEQGLSQGSVLCMLQDSYGLIWLGTRDGLNLYNGYQFITYRHQANDSTSLAGNYINSLAEDASGNIWIATDHGLNCYQRKQDIFSELLIPDEQQEVRKVVVDYNKQVWIATASGLFTYDSVSNKIESTDYNFSSYSITTLYVNARNQLWVGTARHGLFRLEEDRKLYSEFNLEEPTSLSGSNRIETITEDTTQTVWVGTYGNGLFQISNDRVINHFHAQSKLNTLVNNNIRALLCDTENNLWIGTFDGLSILSADRKTIRHIQAEAGVADGLEHNSVRSLLLDLKGSVWIGTYVGGVHIFDRDNQRFTHFYHNPTNKNSLSYNVVGAFAEDAARRLWIGTERGGITIRKWPDHHQTLLHNPTDPATISGNTIKSLLHDNRGYMWVGVFRGGLNRIDTRTLSVKRYPQNQPDSPLAKAIVNSMVITDQTLWLGTDDTGGIHKFDLQTEKFISFNYQQELTQAIGPSPVKQIKVDRHNRLWLATRGSGVIVFDEEAGIIDHITKASHQLPTDEVTSLLFFNDQVFIGTLGGGVAILQPNNKSLTTLTTRQGLLNDLVLGLLPDAENQVWITTINGLSRYQSKQNTFTNYAAASGFPLVELNEGALYQLHNGRILAGGSNGYVVFNPSQIGQNKFVPPVIFTDLLLYNKSVRPADGTGILNQQVLVSREITLDWHHTVFTIEFAALSYLRAAQNQYKYLLEGFDEEWRDAGNRKSVTFTNLRDGTYTLLVKGSNNEGIWNETPARLVIHVLPPPWKTWWAFVLYTCLIAGGFWLIRYNALKSAHLKHELKWEQKDKQRMAELHQLKLQYFSEVSHEFRTPLTLIVSPLDKLLQTTQEPGLQKHLRMMYYNCRRLLLLIDQVLEMHQVETGHAKLSAVPVSVIQIVRNVVDSFQNLADHRNIALTFQASQIEGLHEVDVDKLEKIFFNLLSNAFKFSMEGGLIQVKVRSVQETDTTWFVCMVSDTGRGIPADQLDRIFERFYKSGQHSGSGIGLSLTKSLTQLMGGQISASSKLNEGSTFTLRIPFRKVVSTELNPAQQALRPLPLDYQINLIQQAQEELTDSNKELILLVEDNDELRHYLKEQLSSRYQIITARNGIKGLQKAQKFAPQLIVSDISMDGMDGIELCRHIKTDLTLSHIPVILLTAKNSDSDRLQGLTEGADDYVSKPFILHELELRIANVLTNRKRLQEKLQKSIVLTPANNLVTNHDEKLLEKFLQLLEENLENSNLSVEWLSSELALSRVHLFRKIKALTGKAPAEFIRNFRLQRAAQLLQQKLKVADVAYRVGFEDVLYFSKCFKKLYGCSPTEFAASPKTEV